MPKKRTLDSQLTPVEWLLEQLEERGHIIPDHLQETALNKENKLNLDNPKTVLEHIFYNWESMSRFDFYEYMLNNKQTLLREEKEQMEDYAESLKGNDVTYAKSWETPTASLLPDGIIIETPIQQNSETDKLPPLLLHSKNPFENWCPLSEFKEMFNYRPTQMSALLKDSTLKVAKVGKKKFILRESIVAFLEKKSKS